MCCVCVVGEVVCGGVEMHVGVVLRFITVECVSTWSVVWLVKVC